MTKYGMVIDLKRCVGCNACTVACKFANGLGPGMFYSHVKISETGEYPNARLTVQPTLCNHCDNAACVDVCPVGATVKREDGIVTVDESKCLGCRYCMIACPYDVRLFIDKNRAEGTYFPEKGQTPYEEATYRRHMVGTVEKCDFCSSRLSEGKDPACVHTCPADARIFGDLDDPNSNVAQRLVAGNAHVQLEEAGTKPNVYYV